MKNSFRKYMKIERIQEATPIFMVGKICLSDVKEEMIEKGTDGKRYLHFIITSNQEMEIIGDNEYTHSIRYSKIKRGRGQSFRRLGYINEYTLTDEERKRREYKAKKKKYMGPNIFNDDDDDDEIFDEIDKLPF